MYAVRLGSSRCIDGTARCAEPGRSEADSRVSHRHRSGKGLFPSLAVLRLQKAKGVCVYCNHCQPCPAGLDVGLINKYYDLAKAGDGLARDHYAHLGRKASHCVSAATVTPAVPSMSAKAGE